MPKLVCTSCEVELRCTRSGVQIIEWASFGPYKLYFADEWTCPNCGVRISAGFSDVISEHYQDNFPHIIAKFYAEPDKLRFDFESQAQRMQARVSPADDLSRHDANLDALARQEHLTRAQAYDELHGREEE